MTTVLFKSVCSYEVEYQNEKYLLVEIKNDNYSDDIEIWDSEGNEVVDEDLADGIIGQFVDDINNGDYLENLLQ